MEQEAGCPQLWAKAAVAAPLSSHPGGHPGMRCSSRPFPLFCRHLLPCTNPSLLNIARMVSLSATGLTDPLTHLFPSPNRQTADADYSTKGHKPSAWQSTDRHGKSAAIKNRKAVLEHLILPSITVIKGDKNRRQVHSGPPRKPPLWKNITMLSGAQEKLAQREESRTL